MDNYNDPRNLLFDQRKDMHSNKTTSKTTNTNTSFEQNAGNNTASPTAQQINYIKNLAKYYDGQGEDKLIQDIYNNVRAQKAEGKLSNAQIEQFARTVSPMLSPSQREKLNELVIRLKETT